MYLCKQLSLLVIYTLTVFIPEWTACAYHIYAPCYSLSCLLSSSHAICVLIPVKFNQGFLHILPHSLMYYSNNIERCSFAVQNGLTHSIVPQRAVKQPDSVLQLIIHSSCTYIQRYMNIQLDHSHASCPYYLAYQHLNQNPLFSVFTIQLISHLQRAMAGTIFTTEGL